MDIRSLQERAASELKRFDPEGIRHSRSPRPYMIELFGTPKAGKSTIKEMLKHLFRRSGWRVSAPTEGAEVVEWKRDEPVYNFQTCEYALSAARDRSFSDFHVVIFDRAIYDGVVRMEYYAQKGTITREQQSLIEGYYLLPWNTDLFDLHICLVSTPEVAIRRELAHALTEQHGKTMNPETLKGLLAAHESMWARRVCEKNPKLTWHDSSVETEEQTAKAVLESALDAFERRIIV
ncbi:hypothetical protein ACFLZO_00590 [Patescibacteria group bacterium]